MRRVLGLVAFGSMLLCAGYISDVSAARDSSQLRMKQLKKDPKVKEYIKLLKAQDSNQNQTTSSKKKKKKKSKKNKTNQMTQMGQMNSLDQDQDFNQNQTTSNKKKKRKKKKSKKNQANQMTQMEQMNSMGQIQNTNQTTGSKKKKKKRKKKKTNNAYVLNEPIIDSSKLKKSSLVVEKDIKLAQKSDTQKIETKLDSKDSPAKTDKTLLAKSEVKNDTKLALKTDDSAQKIKEQLQQISNARKAYNLIWTPNKTIKDNIQVNEFRAELDHYRKLYSANLKNA